jgi:radical SAM superfamily enzyme YgiQ (UPF0313 family)
MKKILLVVPEPIRVQYYSTMAELRSLGAKAVMAPLNIATIAAVTPDDIQVDLWDELVHGRIDENTEMPDYDLVGVSSLRLTFPRAKEIARVFRARSIPVAVGGAGVSSTPERCCDDFDILFIGEAELTWPMFIADWKAGNHRSVYHQVPKFDLSLSPPPRWDSLADHMASYLAGAVQTTRGCPFDCEFCEGIYLFGRGMRCKPIDKVLEEIAALKRLGMQNILFCDDNFTGDIRYTKELLGEVISLNNSFPEPMEFISQLSIDVAKDEEMLELLADANFNMIIIGIESPNLESLKETHKYHNVRRDLLEDCKKIQSYGLMIRAGMTVGYDHDTPEIFDQQFDFLQEAGIPLASITVLKAAPGAKLWHRLKKEGRLLRPDYEDTDVNFALCNVIPKNMTRVRLLTGYGRLIQRFYDWKNFTARVKRMISFANRKPKVPKKKLQWKALFLLPRFLLSIDKEARRSILSIIFYTLTHKPFMIRKLFLLIIQQYGYSIMIRSFRETYYQALEKEKSMDIQQLIDRSAVGIPDHFNEPFHDIFPDIHQQIFRGLIDKKQTYEALIKVFTDFLAHQRPDFKEFSDQHKSFLQDLAHRVVIEENSHVSTPVNSSPANLSEEPAMTIKTKEVAQEVLKFVEQQLRV